MYFLYNYITGGWKFSDGIFCILTRKVDRERVAKFSRKINQCMSWLIIRINPRIRENRKQGNKTKCRERFKIQLSIWVKTNKSKKKGGKKRRKQPLRYKTRKYKIRYSGWQIKAQNRWPSPEEKESGKRKRKFHNRGDNCWKYINWGMKDCKTKNCQPNTSYLKKIIWPAAHFFLPRIKSKIKKYKKKKEISVKLIFLSQNKWFWYYILLLIENRFPLKRFRAWKKRWGRKRDFSRFLTVKDQKTRVFRNVIFQI